MGMFNSKINKKIDFEMELKVNCSGEDPSIITYKLVGIIRHYGNSSHSGHYVAFVLSSNGQWYEMNDSQVTAISAKRVLEQEAYVLFYTRCPSTIPSSTQEKSIEETTVLFKTTLSTTTNNTTTTNSTTTNTTNTISTANNNSNNNTTKTLPSTDVDLDVGEKLSKRQLQQHLVQTNSITTNNNAAPNTDNNQKNASFNPTTATTITTNNNEPVSQIYDYSGHLRIRRLSSTSVRPLR